MRPADDIPLSLYVHLPWCVQKCPYCDFNSWTMADDAPLERYLDALLIDLGKEQERAGERVLHSIFIGGGTPSVFAPGQIGRLLDEVARRFALADDIEITMEANPGTVDCGDPAGYKSAGVNRLSIGAQSFSPASLQLLGRIHGVDDIGRAVGNAREAGFDNVNIDLMYGIPGQSVDAAVFDIEQAARLGPDHVSWYQLTLEPNTVFHARPPAGMPDDEQGFEIQRAGQARLAELGFEQYEVSAYARQGKHCRHNVNYWMFGDYLAAGAGAHGKISDAAGIWRYAKPANPKQYIAAFETGGFEAELRPLGGDDRLFEFMLNVLRLNDAFSGALFVARTGLAVEQLEARATTAIERDLIAKTGPDSWQVTPLGRRFLNDLQAEFLPA